MTSENSEAPPAHGSVVPAGDDPLAAELRGFGPLGILAAIVVFAGNGIFAPLSAVFVLVWAWRSRTPWHEIGYLRPTSWILSAFIGVVFGGVFKLLMKAMVMPLLGADPINPAFHYLVGNTAALPGMLFSVTIGAGWGEETLFRGFLFERLGKLLGSGPSRKVAIVLLTSVLFGLLHYPLQGVAGTQQALIFGLVFGTIYTITRRLWMLMCAHAAFDLTAVAIIYWDLESDVAHLIFD